MIDVLPAEDAPATQAGASFAEITARRRGRLRRYLYRRPRMMDAVVVAAYLLLVAPTAVDAGLDGQWAVPLLLGGVAGALLFRRRHPAAVLASVAVLEFAVSALHPWGSNVSAGLWFALYSVALTRPRRWTLMAMATATAPLLALYAVLALGPLDGRLPSISDHTPEDFQLISSIAAALGIVLSNVIAAGIGISVRQRRDHEQEIAAWARATAQLGSATERNRIAREMHDVVAHSLTVMVTLSDGAAVVMGKDPARAAAVLGELSHTGRTALADMRRVLGVLREDTPPGAGPWEPLAAGGNLAKLLAGFRAAGLPLHYTQSGPALPEDTAFQLTVYRIVQESLTNVLRYGRALGRVDLRIERDGAAVTIEVVDDGKGSVEPAGPALGSGQGLAGMRERARIYAGDVEAGPAGGGGWRVRVVLNLTDDLRGGQNGTDDKGEP
ncbi:sensor histidine kinase [Arthrobacter sp. Soil763]|uniref:sensor histidine kinase n=1 Tax=Arthrobacter sp. Soil763 TaxID=1736402 RepID=UPI000701C6AA|nr:histidine kinase [Arthrobacter sp. Soil763]KRE81980.1 histidine kinase [Arthrobacter sp. Soil763]